MVPTLAVLKTPEELTSYEFPVRCCAKGTAASGQWKIITDGKVNKAELREWFNTTHYDKTREANYRFLQPKIIVEPLVFDGNKFEDIRLFVYKGRVGMIMCDFDTTGDGTSRRIFDRDWKDLQCTTQLFPMSQKSPAKPKNLTEMVLAAESLGSYFDFFRVDLFVRGNEFLVGEITHCHGSADAVFVPQGAEEIVSRILFQSA